MLKIEVPPTYPEGCQVVCVGEAPGADELVAKEGFIGGAGKLLQKIVWSSGVAWESIGRTNVSKRAPDADDCGACLKARHKNQQEPRFDSEHFKNTFYTTTRQERRKIIQPTEELQAWYALLADELKAKKLRVAVACGNEALKALCGIEGISKYKGSVLESTLVPGLKVVPIMHPSWILRKSQWQELYISSHILHTKVRPLVSSTVDVDLERWQEVVRPGLFDCEDFIRKCMASGTTVAIDIETRGGSIACVGLAGHFKPDITGSQNIQYSSHSKAFAYRAICIPIQTTTGPYWQTAREEYHIWRALQDLVQHCPIVGHNIFYDMAWLRDYGLDPIDVHDTMLLWHRYYPELPKGLDFVNMWFNWIPYYKDDGKTWGFRQPDEKLWLYNLKDCIATLWIYEKLCALKDQMPRAYKLYENYTRKLMPLAFEMQCRGLPVDMDGLECARGVLEAELDKIRSLLVVLSNGCLIIKPNNKKVTDDQIIAYLYNTLKLKPKYNRKTKAVTADEDAIVSLIIENPDLEVLKAILAERKFAKALNSYIEVELRPL